MESIILIVSSMHSLAAVTIYRVFYKFLGLNQSFLKGKRDRAILATLLYYALRRDELFKLKVKDFKQERRGVPHMKISGKG